MAECEGCALRRKIAMLSAAAVAEWSKNPMGPNIRAIYQRLLAEATARGDFNEP